MDLSKGDIILVPFPFTNLKSSKIRPALVLFYSVDIRDAIILPITSQRIGKFEYLIDNECLLQGKLPLQSYVRINKVATLHDTLIRKKVAVLKRNILNEILILFKGQF